MTATNLDSMSFDGATVLVVEDEQHLTTLYLNWLNDTHSVQTAADGEEALKLVDAEVDVVLLDRQLPKLSGEEVLRGIRERDLSCQVVVMSGVEPDFDLVNMEFDSYLVKPVSREEVCTAVRQVLAQASYYEKLREFHTLSRKRTLIDEQKTESERETSEEYAELTARLADIGEQLDAIAATIEESDTRT